MKLFEFFKKRMNFSVYNVIYTEGLRLGLTLKLLTARIYPIRIFNRSTPFFRLSIPIGFLGYSREEGHRIARFVKAIENSPYFDEDAELPPKKVTKKKKAAKKTAKKKISKKKKS